MKATIVPDEIAVVYSTRPELNLEFLRIDIPNGWDDVKKIHKKVLMYDGKRFTFCSWNSDHLHCHFNRHLGIDPQTAKFVRK